MTDLTFGIRNDGADTLNLTLPLGISGSGAYSVITPPPAAIAPGMTEDVVVRFAPITEGLKIAVLTITSDDPNESSCTVNLSGSVGITIPALSEWGLFLFGLVVFTVSMVAAYNIKNTKINMEKS